MALSVEEQSDHEREGSEKSQDRQNQGVAMKATDDENLDHRPKPPDTRIPMRPAIVENLTKDPSDPEAGAPKFAEGLFGILPSDIDKYSRLVFPVIFISFNLTYWIIYLHISDTLGEDNVALS